MSSRFLTPPPAKGCLAILQAATALHRAGRIDEALAGYDRALRMQPRNPEALRLKGAALGGLGRWSEAIAILETAVEVQPKSAEAYYGLGNARQTSGDLAGAETAYRRALALRPKFPEALVNFGNLLMTSRRWTEAAEVCRQAVELKPGWAMGWSNLSVALRESDRVDEAVSAARRALDEDPQLPEALHHLGRACEEMLDWASAEAAYRKLQLYHGPSAESHFRLGVVYHAQGQVERAAAAWQQAAELSPDNPDIARAWAHALAELGRQAEADAVLARVTDVPAAS